MKGSRKNSKWFSGFKAALGVTNARRATWAGLDQVTSSLANLATTFVVARFLGAESLGELTLAMSLYFFLEGLSRALVSEPMLAGGVDSSGSALTLAGVAGAASWVVVGPVLVFTNAPTALWVTLAIMLPGLLAHDVCRYSSHVQRNPRDAAMLGTIRVASQVVVLPMLLWWRPTVEIALLGWAAGAWMGTLWWMWTRGIRPQGLRVSIRWWNSTARHLGVGLGLKTTIGGLYAQAIVWTIGGMLGIAAVGHYKLAISLIRPMGFPSLAASMLLQPVLRERPKDEALRLATKASWMIGGVTVVVGLVTLVGAGPLTPVVFGPQFEEVRRLLLPSVLSGLAVSLPFAFTAVLKADERRRWLVGASGVSAVVGIVLVLGAASTGSLVAVVWGVVVGQSLFALLVWFGRMAVGRTTAQYLGLAARGRAG